MTTPYWAADIEDESILHYVTSEATEERTHEPGDPLPDLCGECCGDHLHKGDIGEEAWSDLTSRLIFGAPS